MAGEINFYREADVVKEAVIPKQDGEGLSSDAKEAHVESASQRSVGLVGDNRLIHGISVRYPEYLVKFFHNIRVNLNGTIERASNALEEKSSKYYKHEHSITSTIASLHSDPREELVPGFTYIAVAAMTGSVLSKGRNFLYRFSAPVILGAACFSYVLPKTFQNTMHMLHDIESQYFPYAVSRQDALLREAKLAACRTASFAEGSVKLVQHAVTSTRHNVKEWTGLNVE